MDTTNSSEKPQRRVEDRKPAEVIDWAAPGAPAVPVDAYSEYSKSCQDRGILPCSRESFEADAARPAATSGDAPADDRPIAEVAEDCVLLLRKQPNGERWPVGTKLYAGIERAAAPATASGDERADFEAWHRSKFATKHCTGQPTRDMHNGVYAEQYSPEYQQLMWEAWQARAAVSAATKPPSERDMAIAQAVRQACCNCYSPDDSADDWGDKMGDIDLSRIIARFPLAATKPTADLSTLMRFRLKPTATGNVMVQDNDGSWVKLADVQSLLATKPAAAPAVPEGFVLVPANVTPEMQRAYFAVIDKNMPKVTTSPTFGRWDSMREAYRAMLAATPAASTIGAAQTADQVRDHVRDAVAEALSGTYYCNRVWSAWSVGTMSEDDFTPADEDDDILDGVVDAVFGTLSPTTTHNSEAGAPQPTEGADK